jgi:ketosteroid isomerase-like protein
MRKKHWVAAAALTLSVFTPPSYARESPQQQLRRLEDELSLALVRRDAVALESLWHDDLIFIGTNGRQFGKVERIAGQKTATPPQPGETNVNDEVVVRVDGDSAVVTVRSTWTFPASPNPSVGHYLALHVWTHERGRWQLVAAQVALLRD